ncbi:uncharacterized protein BO80DRAFT_450273 [Aspergillus ibericus CBS 121593]|uniref:Uncharacterized protein n=1 Tax=Aspergillus ibericus CBS 121593 TaxID=1448316 RepID=A0A395GIS0_9EURO|nr:hypothetical protein BO80DRAFT_450273 [Aspergillus ibericus CBS 121593]RAK95339.1 hypothetical protein BO80DRAFT_450273 [Aspergillus ibericus CBS 121593]
MRLRSLCVTGIWLASCAATPIPDHPGDGLLPQTPLSTPHSPPVVTGHEIHIPCAKGPGPESDHEKSSKAYLAMKFHTESNALLANNASIFPASYPMHLPATRYQESGQGAEDVLLQYAVNIDYIHPNPEEWIQDVYHVEVKLFDLAGRPATTDTVTVRLSRQQQGELYISQIMVEPLLQYHDVHGDGNCLWHVKYWKMIVSKYRAWRKTQGHGRVGSHWQAIPSDDAAANTPIPTADKAYTSDGTSTADRARPDSHAAPVSPFRVFGVDRSPRPVVLRPSGHHRDFWRLVVPAIIPALLGATAGLVVCMMGLLVWKIVVCTCGRRQGRRCREAGGCQRERCARSEKQRLLDQDQLSLA